MSFRFGELEILPEPEKRHPDHPEVFNLSNVRPDGEIVSFDEPQAVFCEGRSDGTPTARFGRFRASAPCCTRRTLVVLARAMAGCSADQ